MEPAGIAPTVPKGGTTGGQPSKVGVARGLVRWLARLGQVRSDFVVEAIRATGARKVLDVGCGQGWQLAGLDGCERWGVEMDAEALAVAREAVPDATFVLQTGANLPFPEAEFDAVILAEVIEHVGEAHKQTVIDEIHRVLRPDGALVLTAPYAGVFAWTDPLDVKRRFPSAYRVYLRLSGHRQQTATDTGHKHLSEAEIDRLFSRRFEVTDRRYTGPFSFLLVWIQVLALAFRLPDRLVWPFNRFRSWENGVRCPRVLAYNVRLVARRI
jgi:SAM-dependent methyltransferase